MQSMTDSMQQVPHNHEILCMVKQAKSKTNAVVTGKRRQNNVKRAARSHGRAKNNANK